MLEWIRSSAQLARRWRSSSVAGYLLAAGVTTLAALLRWALPDVLTGTPYLVFYPAVVAAAAFGGLGPGLLATVGTVLCVDLLFDPTPWRVELANPVAMSRLALFLAGGAGVSLLAEMQQRGRIRERRQNQEGRLRAAALDAAANGIAITNAAGTIVWVNQAFTALTGYDREELIGRNHRILKSGEQNEAYYRSLWETIRRGEVWHGELINRRKDGSLYIEEQSITPLKDGQGAIIHYIAIKQDISARKTAEQAAVAARISAERAKEQAEEANRAKDNFLAVLSHELRTPLMPVLAMVSMLQEEKQSDPEMRDALEMIRRNVELEARLIDDLLDVTRIERGKIELDRKLVEVREVLRRAIEVVQPDMEARHLRFEMDAEEAPCIANADATRLQQVFWNLLKNAVKFTPPGGRVGVRVRREEPGQGDGHSFVTVEVSDSGVGIEPQALSRIFNAFEQGDRSITRRFGGLGLGLAISRALIEIHGGSIEVHSNGKGMGARFCVRLPLVDARSPESGPSAPATPTPAVQPLRILLVEDHGDTARIMRRLLMADGHSVERAGDVATALELAESRSFDLLLSDLGLPDASGLDLMRELRKRGLMLPGIALSGYGQEEDVRRSHEVGFAAHLIKPTSPERLAETIATVAHVTRGT